MASDKPSRQPVVFVSHGAGPMALLPDGPVSLRKGSPSAQFLVSLPELLERNAQRPKAVLVVSAHFETVTPTVYKRADNSLLYDYGGFPREAYALSFAPKGDPALADRVVALLAAAGIACKTETGRGLDHGAFVPLIQMYPDADVPVVELSVLASLSADAHIALGRAIAPLSAEGVLVLGSGSATHGRTTREQTRAFMDWLAETLAGAALTASEREARLADWTSAPHARACHSREEHLLPLHVCAAAAGFARATLVQDDIPIDSLGMCSFVWSSE